MELKELLTLLRSKASGKHAIQTAADYRQFPLQLSYASYNDGIAWLCAQYKNMGLKAEKLDFPADGKTIYADRHYPLAWDVEDGWMKAADPSFRLSTLASYKDDPYGIVPFSADSNGEQLGVIIPASVLREGKMNAKPENIVVLFDEYPSYGDLQWAIESGCKASVACAGIDPSNVIKYNARRWFNDHFGEGQINAGIKTLPSYSLPPKMIVELLEYYKQRGPVPVKYYMRAKTYAGTVAAALAKLEGTDPREKSFMVSAHAYEPNASNNVAGVAVCVEAAGILAALIENGTLPKPRRSIQFFHGLETFGLYAYAMRNPGQIKNILCGLTVDCLGYRDRGSLQEELELMHCSYIHPSFWHALSKNILSESAHQMSVSYKVVENGFSSNDDILNDPMFGPAWNLMYGSEWSKAGFYHSNADTIEQLSPERMAECAVFAAASAYMVANAGKDEVLPFAKLTCQNAIKQFANENAALMGGISADNDAIREKGVAIQLYNKTVVPAAMAAIESPLQLVPENERGALYPQIGELSIQFKKAAADITGSLLNNLAAILGGQAKKLFRSGNTEEEKNAALLVPARRLPGILGLGNQTRETRAEAARFAGYYLDEYWNFMAPRYYWFDGQRTLLDAAMAHYSTTVKGDMVSRKTRLAMLDLFKGMTAFLEKTGYLNVAHITPPPLVTKATIINGLKEIGIQSGDLVFVHSSLSQFGEIQGGPNTLIDALMEVIGYDGILAMPAFTATADGEKEPPFDPTASIAYTGLISNTFWQRKDVLRHGQPTHSIAAWGKRAAEFLKSENPSDTFDWNGPWGNLYRWNGKILTFGETMGATTYLHALEGWFLSYLDKAYARVKEGDGEKLVYIVNYPNGCRGGWYDLRRTAQHFKRLYSRGLYREAKIGAAAALAINVRDLTGEIHALLKEDPVVFLHKTGCLSCAERRARLVGWKIPAAFPDGTEIY